MEALGKITKLCEAWWERLSDSTRADQQKYAEQFLGLLGWSDTALIDTSSREGALSSASFVLRGGGESAVAAHFVMPGSLDPPSSLVERGLDCCEATRLLVNGTRKLNIRYAFVTDLFRSYLYDAQTDELLLHADTPDVFHREIAGVLVRSHVERGSLEEVRRNPRSYAARQLREWCRHWCEAIVSDSDLDKDAGVLAIDRLLVLRYLFDHDIMKRSDWRLGQRFSQVIARAFGPDPKGTGKALTTLFHDIWFDWKGGLFRPHPPLDEVLANDQLAVPMLKEFTLLSKTKFSIATILESFNHGEAGEKARVRLVPETNEERERYLAKQTLGTIDSARIEVDVLEEGYRSIFYWFDKMVELYERLGLEFDIASQRQQQAVPEDMDLFAWGEMDAHRPGALRDKFQHVIENGLSVLHASPRQYRTARLMLYLHLISAYDQCKIRFGQFPPIESTLKERPKMLESEKRWNYQPPKSAGPDEWDVI